MTIHTNTQTKTLTLATTLPNWKAWPQPIVYLVTRPNVQPFMLGCINRVSMMDFCNKAGGYKLQVELLEVLGDWDGTFNEGNRHTYLDRVFYPSINDMLQVWQVE